MNQTVGLTLLFILLVALLYTTGYYAKTANWRRYAAGQSFMTLLVSLDMLVLWTAVARFMPPEFRTAVFAVLMLGLIGAVIFIQRVMRHEYQTTRAAYRKAFAPRAKHTNAEEATHDER